MKVTAFLLAFSLFPTLPGAEPAEEPDAIGQPLSGESNWVSRQGSVMMLDIGPDGLVQGYFSNNAPGKGCRGIPYRLSGRMLGDTITFQVRWRNGVADCMSETQWRGHMQPSRTGGVEIVAEWQRSSTVAAAVPQGEALQNGLDLFTYQAMPRFSASSKP